MQASASASPRKKNQWIIIFTNITIYISSECYTKYPYTKLNLIFVISAYLHCLLLILCLSFTIISNKVSNTSYFINNYPLHNLPWCSHCIQDYISLDELCTGLDLTGHGHVDNTQLHPPNECQINVCFKQQGFSQFEDTNEDCIQLVHDQLGIQGVSCDDCTHHLPSVSGHDLKTEIV